MSIYNPHIKPKIPYFGTWSSGPCMYFRKNEIHRKLETIVTVVYKQHHLALGFHHTWVKFILSLIFPRDHYVFKLMKITSPWMYATLCVLYTLITLSWQNEATKLEQQMLLSYISTLDFILVILEKISRSIGLHSDFCMLLLLLWFMEHPWYPL